MTLKGRGILALLIHYILVIVYKTLVRTVMLRSIIFFYEEAPIMYQGVDTLETDLGTKVTLGDGVLLLDYQ